MTENAMADGGPPRRPWVWPLLTISLMVNLLFLGAAGAFWFSRDTGWGWRGSHHRGITGFVATLPSERRAELDRIIEQEREAMKPLWSEIGRVRREVVESVAEEPLDRAKLDALLGRFAGADAKMREARARKFTEIVTRMTPEERRAFKEWRLKRLRGSWSGRDGGEEHGEGK